MTEAGGAIDVLVVAEHELARAAIVALLEEDVGIRIVGAANSGSGALIEIGRLAPDVVVLDYDLPDVKGDVVCREVVKSSPSCSVIVLTADLEDSIIHACLVAGARAYLPKSVEVAELLHAVHAVARGQAVLTSAVVDRVIEWARNARTILHDSNALLPRETITLALAAEGLSNRAISRKLDVSESTVKARLRSAMQKLGASQRAEAVAVGIRKGLI